MKIGTIHFEITKIVRNLPVIQQVDFKDELINKTKHLKRWLGPLDTQEWKDTEQKDKDYYYIAYKLIKEYRDNINRKFQEE